MDPEQNKPTPSDSRWKKLLGIGLMAYLTVFFILMVAIVLALILGFRYFNQRINNLSQHNSSGQTVESQVPFAEVTVKPDAPTLGSAAAPVTLIEFADFQCPFCKKFQDAVFPQLKAQYIDTAKAKFIFQDFAFLGPESTQAAAAAKCAADQQQFWPFHDLLYAKQGDENSGVFSPANLKLLAGQLKLNQKDFDTCLDSGKYTAAVTEATSVGESFGVSATPTLFVNGKKYEGVASIAEYTKVIDQALADVAN